MLFDEPSRDPLPKTPDFDEVKFVGAKALASLIPGLGELFGLLSSPVAQRRDAWLEDLARCLHDLEEKVAKFHLDDLEHNEKFVSATLQATQAAMKTHQREKREALRNAVLNVALGHEPETDRQTLFLSLIDRFTVLHLAVLRAFADPHGVCSQLHIPVPKLLLNEKMLATQLALLLIPSAAEIAKSPIESRGGSSVQMVESILSDLEGANLLALDPHQQTWSVPRFSSSPDPVDVKPLLTHLGEDFLAFVSEPPEERS